MHPLVRLFGWCLLVAGLIGVFWPERPEPIEATAIEAGPDPAPRTIPAGGPPTPSAAPPPHAGQAAWLTGLIPAG